MSEIETAHKRAITVREKWSIAYSRFCDVSLDDESRDNARELATDLETEYHFWVSKVYELMSDID